MKKISFLALILFSVFYACTPVQYSTWKSPQQQPAVVVDNNNYGDEVTNQTFYDDLAPDGRWINDAELGYVWSPNVGADFRPYYTNGHWTYTDYGWTWISDYNWGWAAFHYGRWKFDNSYGWVWAPGHEWAPAWVQWRKTSDSYGWAPLEPGISVEVGFSSGYHIPDNRWAFVPQQHFGDRDFHRYVPPVQQNNVYINRSVIINNNITNNNGRNNNRSYYAGPEINEVRNVTRQDIQVRNIQNNNRPGATIENSNAVNIYRPRVRENSNQGNRFAPRNVYNQQETTPAARQPNFHYNPPANQNRPYQQNNNQNQSVPPAYNESQTAYPNNRPTQRENSQSQPNYNQGQPNNNNQQPINPNQQAPQKRWNNNNLPTTQPVTPQKQEDKPVLNPSENRNRMPGDMPPNNQNSSEATRQNRNEQPRNEQPMNNNQPQTPQPNNNVPIQNPNMQQLQPYTNPNNQNQNNSNQNAQQDNIRRYQPINRGQQNQTPQNQPQQNQPSPRQLNPNRNMPNPNSGANAIQNSPMQRQPFVRPVEPPKSSTQPVTPAKVDKPVQ